MIPVTKAHAYGNDFLLTPLDRVAGRNLPALARAMCARHTGIGGDGLLLYGLTDDGATMALLNADGSPSELSGNGLRCLAALVIRERERSGAGARHAGFVRAQTGAGEKTLTLAAKGDGRYTFRAALGPPTDVREEVLEVADETLPVVTLGMGNPQCVALMERLPDLDRFNRLGPGLATHPRFPAGTNVEFAVVESPRTVRILIWERGVGPTESSGTGSSAAAVSAMAFGGADRDVTVIAPGGQQRVEWREDGVYLTGWAEIVLDGEWSAARP